ncbi:MAG: OmpA family protein [Eubacterium sp.]|nr:OmpA family protein [Eubacterium sp.]
MKMFNKFISIVLIAVSIMVLFTGCTSGAPRTSTSLVLGIHENFSLISYNNKSIYDSVYDACYSYGDFTAIVVDGNPQVCASYQIKEPDKMVDSSKHKAIAEDYTNQVISSLNGCIAQSPEVDTLRAIIMSADALNESDCEIKKMLIYDSGLSTTGPLNFAEKNIIDADPQILVEQLKEHNAIPDLSGIDVSWVGLGEVCGNQIRLSTSYKAKLNAIYDAILTAGNAKSIDYDTSPLTNETSDLEFPSVTKVPIPQDTIGDDFHIIEFDNETVNFQKDTAEFTDKEIARQALLDVAEYLINHRNTKAVLAASTATYGTVQSCEELAERRGEAVKSLLVEMGVNNAQLRVYAIGQAESRLKVDDLDSNGNLIPEKAEKNRAVFIINEEEFEDYI